MKITDILRKITFAILGFAMITSLLSCEQVDSIPDESDILIKEVTGTWVVDMTYDGAPQGTNTISIYNTGANDDNLMWIDDLEHSWGLKTQVPLNLESLTFSGADLDELYYGVTVNITEGLIIESGTTAPSGDIVDTIFFKAEFSDIPGEIWEYSGYRSTAKVGDLP